MADRHADFLLIGGGVATAACARELREAGGRECGSVLVVGREKDPPYERPFLSKSYLAGRSERSDALYLPPAWWEENEVELLARTSVMKLDTEARVARLSTKEEVSYGTALIATGANVRRLRVDGSDLDGIHYLRAFGNADAIREEAVSASRVVLIGGSYIACELAATLSALGVSCSMLMQEDVVLERVLGREVGGWVQRQLAERGVEIHGSDELARFEIAGTGEADGAGAGAGAGDGDGSGGAEGAGAGDGEGDADQERVARVISRDGLSLECDCVVIGAGVAPDVMLARSAGLELGPLGGVLCSSRLETSAPGVFTAGDMAEYESVLHEGGRARVEHFEVAVEHGRVAARNMLAAASASAAQAATVDDLVPYFWSDLSDWATIEYVGVGPGEPTIRGSIEDGSFTAFYSVEGGGRLVGAATVGRPDDLEHARRLIRERAAPSPATLADEGTDLAAL